MKIRSSAARPSLYLAAPLFTPEERQFNQYLAVRLERKFRVFLPQRDGRLIPGRTLRKKQYARLAKQVFELDIEALRNSKTVFAVLNGRTVDEGVSFELGFGFALGIKLVGYWTDSRVLLPTGMNPMLAGGLDVLIRGEDDFKDWLRMGEVSRLQNPVK